ncbi:MAG: malto-oligosyltrehalose synthase [Opitutaceae bacterium]
MALTQAQRIPHATYRLQFSGQFTFADAERLIGYLRELGISDLYASPIFQSIPGSTHGYDVADYRRINPELGGEPALMSLAEKLRDNGLGLLVDFVSNHMGISGPFNAWWNNVLECGRHSPYARFFDVHWRTPDGTERPHILVPVLDDHYGVILEKGGLRLTYEAGGLRVEYGTLFFPLNAAAYAAVLARVATDRALPAERRLEIEELLHGFQRLAPAATAWTPNPEVPKETHILKERLARLADGNGPLAELVRSHAAALNGRAGEPDSFDALDRILDAQSFRLARWKTGIYATNYRRFFAVDTLIGLRMENPEVFADSHALLALLLRERKVTGLRIDHIDGLWDPWQYLEQLQTLRPPAQGSADGPLYVVAEKILSIGETLPEDWAVHGTTGYEFIGSCANLLTRTAGEAEMTEIYREFAGESVAFPELVYEKKRFVLGEMFLNTLTRLTGGLFTLLTADRHWRDLSPPELAVALREFIACFPVYRTYRRLGGACSAQDVRAVERAFQEAARRNPRFDGSTLEIVRQVLIGTYPPSGAPAERREQIERWVLSFQQYTGAIMAKAVEDTAFYLYNRLIALNEVGGDPAQFGRPVEDFHEENRERAKRTPHGLLASSTHDSKLSEDARARLYVLSEIPEEWRTWVREWRDLNRPHKSEVDGHEAPDPNEEFRLYQALLGVWPPGAEGADDVFRERLRQYLRKAVNEAKLNTTWTEPNEAWLAACDRFIDRMLAPDTGSAFLASFIPKAARLAHLGMIGGLAQTALKLTCPGVPDFYQGNEIWDFSLVDPDNRRPVDFEARERLLAEVGRRGPQDLLQGWRDGGIKLRLVTHLLRFRRDHAELFARGDYEPLAITGPHADSAAAFRRRDGARELAVVVPRQSAKLGCPPLGLVWAETTMALPDSAGEWRDLLTERSFSGGRPIPLAELLAELPLAVLYAEGPGS